MDRSLKLVGEAVDGEQAVELAKRLEPDLIMMEIDMPGIDGLESARRIKGLNPGVKILLLSVLGDEAHVNAALASGADAFLPKDAPISEFLGCALALTRSFNPGKAN